MTRNPLVTEEQLLMLAEALPRMFVALQSESESPQPRTTAAVPRLAREINDAWTTEGNASAMTAVVKSIFTHPPLTSGNVELAAAVLGFLAEELRITIDLGRDQEAPMWLAELFQSAYLSHQDAERAIEENSICDLPGQINRDLRGEGLRAAVACAFSGQAERVRKKNRALGRAVADVLRRFGMDVEDPVDHEGDCRAGTLCNLRKDVDLLVVIGAPPSTRVGHEVGRTAALVAPVLLLIPHDAAYSCLYDSPDAGEFHIKRYSRQEEIPVAIASYLDEDVDRLHVHAEFRTRCDAWHEPQFLELRQLVLTRAQSQRAWPSHWLIGRERALHVVSSIDAYNKESITLLNLLREYMGLAILGADDAARESEADLLFHLLTPEQQEEFETVARGARATRHEQVLMLRTAVRELVGASAGSRRSRSFRSPADWLSVVRRVRPQP